MAIGAREGRGSVSLVKAPRARRNCGDPTQRTSLVASIPWFYFAATASASSRAQPVVGRIGKRGLLLGLEVQGGVRTGQTTVDVHRAGVAQAI